MKFKIALLQVLPAGDDQAKNLEKGIEACRKAKEQGADLVLFPELWNIGFTSCPFDEAGRARWEQSAIDQNSEFFRSFRELAKELETNIAITYLEKTNTKPKNSVSIINAKGEVALNYSKVFICDFGKVELQKENPDADEIGCDYNCAPGSTFEVATLGGKEGAVKVGAMICADREFPETATQLMLNGAELIVVPNASDWNDIRRDTLKARAFENLVGVAMVNYPAPKFDGRSTAHTSVVWDGNGQSQDQKILEAGEEEGIFLVEFDMDAIRNFRKIEAWRLDYRKKWYASLKSTPTETPR